MEMFEINLKKNFLEKKSKIYKKQLEEIEKWVI
jgi:hypothetical protein